MKTKILIPGRNEGKTLQAALETLQQIKNGELTVSQFFKIINNPTSRCILRMVHHWESNKLSKNQWKKMYDEAHKAKITKRAAPADHTEIDGFNMLFKEEVK